MIYNMHIRNDFQLWLETPKKRVTTLCGKITATKYAGIPGVTKDQAVGVWNDGQDVGWCLSCCVALLSEFDNNDFLWERKLSSTYVYYLYTDAIEICGMQLARHYQSAQDRSPTSLD